MVNAHVKIHHVLYVKQDLLVIIYVIKVKDGYFNSEKDYYCDIRDCEQCSENSFLKCKTNYYYNYTTKSCEKNEININYFDQNCKTSFSEEIGACEECKNGYENDKGKCFKLNSPHNNNKCPGNYF